MIVLDTNVLSELTRQVPDPAVLAWLDGLPGEDVGTTAITAAELLYGVSRLAEGRRKAALIDAVYGLLRDDLAGRVEPFDEDAAACYADLVAERERHGRSISMADAQIAAICEARGHSLATRNTRDFLDAPITLINPWEQ